VDSPRLWSLSILNCVWENVGCCRVRWDASSRARGSAEELARSGNRRKAIEVADMKVSVKRRMCENQ
jgi:hypothetical protein